MNTDDTTSGATSALLVDRRDERIYERITEEGVDRNESLSISRNFFFLDIQT